ncbi:MAG: hypothetical protein HY021_09690 [Burkholderiales bacterium]|nr:hypothetical protein [Burkholderiales bacterium]
MPSALRGLPLLGDNDNSLHPEALSLARELKDDESIMLLSAADRRVRVFRGDLAGELIARNALEPAQERSLRAVLPHIYVSDAAMHIRLSRSAGAIELLLKAYSAFNAVGTRLGVARTLVDMAHALRAPEGATAMTL